MPNTQVFLKISLISSLVFATARAGVGTEGFDTPTGLARDKGEVGISLTAYDGGGLNVQASMALAPFLELGVVGYATGLIGNGAAKFEIPGISGKIRFTDSAPEGFNVAVGYMPLFHGGFSEGTIHPYGPYAVATKGFFLWAPLPHLFSFGAAYPLVPEPGRPMAFVSLALHFGSLLQYLVEVTDVNFNPESAYDFINNHSLRLNLGEHLAIQAVFQWAGKVAQDPVKKENVLNSSTSRTLRVVWQGSF